MPKRADLKKPRWQPFEWQVKYEKVVIWHCKGLNNVEIAELSEYTPQHVANILGCDQAIEIIKLVKEALRKQTLSIPDELAGIAQTAVKRIKQALSDDEVYAKAPLGVADRALKILEGLNHLKRGTEVQNNTFVLPESVATAMMNGMAQANKARELNTIDAEDVKVLQLKKPA